MNLTMQYQHHQGGPGDGRPKRGRLVALYSSMAGSGKSEVANVLMREFGFEPVKFAGPLKAMARGLFDGMGFDAHEIERMLEGDLKEVVIPGFATVTPRRVMQTLGTDWGREAIDQDLWIKVARTKIEGLLARGVSVVVDDLRFPNELLFVRAMRGVAVRIVRPDPSRDGGSSRYEGLLDNADFDFVLDNDGSLGTLKGKARLIARA